MIYAKNNWFLNKNINKHAERLITIGISMNILFYLICAYSFIMQYDNRNELLCFSLFVSIACGLCTGKNVRIPKKFKIDAFVVTSLFMVIGMTFIIIKLSEPLFINTYQQENMYTQMSYIFFSVFSAFITGILAILIMREVVK